MSNLDSWYHEKESAWLYQQVAAAEPDARKRQLFLQLAAAAEEQAGKWEAAAARQSIAPAAVTPPAPGTTHAEPAAARTEFGATRTESGVTRTESGASRTESGATRTESRATRSESGATRTEPAAARSGSGATRPEPATARSESGAARSESGAARSESGAARPESGATRPAPATPSSAALAAVAGAIVTVPRANIDTAPKRVFTPSLRARIVARLIKQFGPRPLRTVLAAMKLRGLSVYSAPVSIAAGHAMPTSLSDVGARHRGGLGNNLRASVFGVSDGLVSNASLVLGVAGAGAASGYVLVTGTAGILAGALSMAAGEYVSVRSQREMYEYQIALEREEVAEYPEEEAEELALIYEARGVEIGQAREVSRALLANPDQALDVLSREELGLNPDDLGSPFGAALSSFLSFALGAAIPLIPFVVTRSTALTTLVITAALTVLALFGIGCVLSLFTGRDALKGALRMVLIGAGAGIVSFLVGKGLGAAIGAG